MSPPAHLMLRGLPQRAASLELAWHAALRQKDIHTTECLYAPECCQPARANAMAKPPAHVLAPRQPHPNLGSGWLDFAAGSVISAEAEDFTSVLGYVLMFWRKLSTCLSKFKISCTLMMLSKLLSLSPAWCLLLSLHLPLSFTSTFCPFTLGCSAQKCQTSIPRNRKPRNRSCSNASILYYIHASQENGTMKMIHLSHKC